MRLYEEDPEIKTHLPHKHDVISLLAVGGHWVTTEDHLQVSNYPRYSDVTLKQCRDQSPDVRPKPNWDTPLFDNNVSITAHSLQLDPPDSRTLFLKAASISFLNEEVWEASRARQGRYLRILMKPLGQLCSSTLLFNLYRPRCSYDGYKSTDLIVAFLSPFSFRSKMFYSVSYHIISITFSSYKYSFPSHVNKVTNSIYILRDLFT